MDVVKFLFTVTLGVLQLWCAWCQHITHWPVIGYNFCIAIIWVACSCCVVHYLIPLSRHIDWLMLPGVKRNFKKAGIFWVHKADLCYLSDIVTVFYVRCPFPFYIIFLTVIIFCVEMGKTFLAIRNFSLRLSLINLCKLIYSFELKPS